jgi:ribosomal protein L11 methylase PrmA
MLQDAALLHLELLQAALAEDVIIKDGTAYNMQWVGSRPVFIDVTSFERLPAGWPWAGYRQFCQTFLFPLMLQAYKGVSFQPWIRGNVEGIAPQECRNLMSIRDFFRRGVPTHVFLHAWLESRRRLQKVDAMQALPAAGFSKALIGNNVAGLQRLIRGLRWFPRESTWSGYAANNTYSPADQRQKEEFVRQTAHSRRWKLVWDLGANTGTYSRIAAAKAETVVALDADHFAVESLYQSLKDAGDGGNARILPLVVTLADPSAGRGWRGIERRALIDRGRPELTLCLALIHHLVIGHGVPVRELIDWLAEICNHLVIEFVDKQDPMVVQLLRGRRDNYSDYDRAHFERSLGERFEVHHSEVLGSGTRKLYYATSRSIA